MNKIWVVEMKDHEGNWYPATMLQEYHWIILAFRSYYVAHRHKNHHYRYLKSIAPKIWTRKRLRVRAWYQPVETVWHKALRFNNKPVDLPFDPESVLRPMTEGLTGKQGFEIKDKNARFTWHKGL